MSHSRDLAETATHASSRTVNATLELLAPLAIVHRILHDWFKYVHPLAPILHRQHLFQRIKDQDQDADPVFAAMVISVCSVTVSTLRRRSFEEYPSVTVGKCNAIIEEQELLLRQPHPYSLDWCIAWYHIASALQIKLGLDDVRVYRAIKEAMTSVNYLLCFQGDQQTSQDKELLKRLYWLLYMWQV